MRINTSLAKKMNADTDTLPYPGSLTLLPKAQQFPDRLCTMNEDELSLVIAPVTADGQDKPLLMDAAAEAYELVDVKRYDGGVVWMNYRAKRQ